MADLASTSVQTLNNWQGGGFNGKRYSYREVILTLTAQGTTANKITAAVLGFSKIAGASPAVQSTDATINVAAPSYDGSMLLLKAAATAAPADFTGTVKLTVWGVPL